MTDTTGLDGRLFDLDEWAPPTGLTLAERFTVPPMSVLDTRQGYWQDRKREWLSLGIESELGRDGNVAGAMDEPDYARNGMDTFTPGTSVFDPVLTEAAVRWYSRPGSKVLDPFAGGSVRGIVSAVLGRTYVGIDLRLEQVVANCVQAERIMRHYPDAPRPTWLDGDSRERLDPYWARTGDADMILSCPPYVDLERYSDDPRDLSTMDYGRFLPAYTDVVRLAIRALKPDRFAVWVVGEARDTARQGSPSYGFVADTVKAFQQAGADLYNEAILLNRIGTTGLRTARQFVAGRKMPRVHQHVLVFVKGDPMAAAAWVEGDGS